MRSTASALKPILEKHAIDSQHPQTDTRSRGLKSSVQGPFDDSLQLDLLQLEKPAIDSQHPQADTRSHGLKRNRIATNTTRLAISVATQC
jgi:hypothetical protein